MKLKTLVVVTLAILLLNTWIAVKRVEAQGQSQIRLLEVRDLDRGSLLGSADIPYRLKVICDAPRGNIVYIATGGGVTSLPMAITALHQPDACK
jgi:hypothetical protein